MGTLLDLTGQKFGYLTAETYYRKNGVTYWRCRCNCGRYRDINTYRLRKNKIHDCGKCFSAPLKKQKTTDIVHLDSAPFIEDFPVVYPFPKYIIWNLRNYGNAFVAERVVKRLGWNGIQYHCAKYGLKVTVLKTDNNNFIIETFNKRRTSK